MKMYKRNATEDQSGNNKDRLLKILLSFNFDSTELGTFPERL